ncbi:MAG: DUF5009 domain-containing protein [Meiothermus sp.]|nr:DUF5009 domain-containing protein [Meiothermus sp.]
MVAQPGTVQSAKSTAHGGAAGGRLLALDGLRGLTVLLMLLVNNIALQAATPDQLMHAPFGGVTLADLVFPWFLFCMGVAIPRTASSPEGQKLPRWHRVRRILTRTALMFGLGLFLTSALARTPVFALGVLQLIALAYCAAALIYLASPRPAFLCGAAALLLVGYWAAIRLVPVPGVGPGVFEEGRNLLLHINRAFLEPLGLRGLPSVVPTAALALLGAVVGQLLQGATRRQRGTGQEQALGPSESRGSRTAGAPSFPPPPYPFLSRHRPLPQLLLLGIGLTLLGHLWSLELPFSKTFWTPPYIVLTAGLGTLVIGVFYALFDLRGWRWAAFPLLVLGSNALLAYVLPILFKVWVLQGWTVRVGGQRLSLQQAWLNGHIAHAGVVLGGWAYTLLYTLLWWAVLWWFYRRKVFLRV